MSEQTMCTCGMPADAHPTPFCYVAVVSHPPIPDTYGGAVVRQLEATLAERDATIERLTEELWREKGGVLTLSRANRDLAAEVDRQAAQVAVLREALEQVEFASGDADGYSRCPWCLEEPGAHHPDCERQAALADPNPAAERLVAERDAGRALYEAVVGLLGYEAEQKAVEVYRKVVETA